jgi:hypothetical protein
MKVFAICSNCKREITFNSKHKTRVEFAKQKGETKTLYCKSCAHKNKFKVDELFAKESKTALIVACLIFFFGIPFVLYYITDFVLKIGGLYSSLTIGGFILIPIIVYKTIKYKERIRISTFNSKKLKDE